MSRALILFALLVSACATNGRYIVLEEFATSLPPQPASPLKGVKVYVGTFTYTRDPAALSATEAASEPPAYVFREMEDSEAERWDDEYRRLKDSGQARYEIGNLRNGFGMTLSHVYALNEPGEWIQSTLRSELEGRGAVIVPTADAADVSVSGAIQYLGVDMYMVYWSDLVLDLTVQPAHGTPVTTPLHTYGKQGSWSSSSFEFYQPIRRAQQQMMFLMFDQIERAVAAGVQR